MLKEHVGDSVHAGCPGNRLAGSGRSQQTRANSMISLASTKYNIELRQTDRDSQLSSTPTISYAFTPGSGLNYTHSSSHLQSDRRSEKLHIRFSTVQNVKIIEF